MMPRTIQVFEHSALKIDPEIFPESYFDRLVLYNELNQNRFFEVGHRRLYFGSYVGVMQVGKLTIEILPKADRSEQDGQTKWRDALLQMLKTCRHLQLEPSGTANLHLRSDSLIDLYFEAYLCACEKLMREGLRKSYRSEEGNRGNLKGRLVFSEQIKRNLIHKERFYTRRVEYNRNARHNQILVVALSVLGQIGRPTISSRAKTLLLELEDIEPVKVTRETFERLTYDRNTNRYRDALQLARLIILNYSPDLRAGRDDVIAILFDMNKLFEEYVYRCLKKASEGQTGIYVSAQQSKVFWKSEQMRKTIRPDIVVDRIEDEQSRRVIIDTKWKVPKANRPADDDLKQMYAYNLQFGATQSILLYPRTQSSQDMNGRYSEAPNIHSANQHCSQLYFADLFDESGKLSRTLGQRILDNLQLEEEQKRVNPIPMCPALLDSFLPHLRTEGGTKHSSNRSTNPPSDRSKNQPQSPTPITFSL